MLYIHSTDSGFPSGAVVKKNLPANTRDERDVGSVPGSGRSLGVGNGNPLLSSCKEIQPVHPKGNQSWVFIGRTNVEAETLILWPPDAKS